MATNLDPLDLDELRKIVAIKHDLLLGPDDPVLVTLTLNELVLARYLDMVNLRSEEAERLLMAAINEHINAAKTSAGAIITDAANYVNDQVRQAVHAAVLDAGRELQKQLVDAQAVNAEIKRAGDTARTASRMAMISALIAVVVGVVILLGVGGFVGE